MTTLLEIAVSFGLPFALGGLVIGTIVRAIDNRTINDLKNLLRGFGVLREQKPNRFRPIGVPPDRT